MTLDSPLSPTIAPLKRRLICMVYEAVLLFGIFFCADFLFDVLTQSQSATTLRHWRQFYLFMVVGIYFTYFWRKTGQTLPMQTWRIKVVSAANGQLPTFKQAWLRYLGAWMWVLPALAVNDFLGITQWASVAVFGIGILVWALTSKLDKQGQFLHDKLAGTRLVFLNRGND